MKKKDVIASLIIGFLTAIFSLIVLINISPEINLTWKKEWILVVLAGFPILAFLGFLIILNIGKKFKIVYQIGKFIIVGVSNNAVDLGFLNLLMCISGIVTGLPYIAFRGISALMAIINSYFWNKHWTFQKKDNFFSLNEFSKFIIIVSIGFLIDILIASLIVVIVGPQFGLSEKIWANLGALASIFIVFIWNFTGYKLFVFKKAINKF